MTAVGDGGQKEQHTTTENWRDSDTHLVVSQPQGYFCNLSLLARVPLPPACVFQILTDPGNARIFKSIKAIKSRRVLWNDGKGRQLVEVEQVVGWRFLVFRGTFINKVLVEEDRNNHSIRVELAQPGFMRRFQGTWLIRPFTQDSLDHLLNHDRRPQGGLHSLQASFIQLQDRLRGKQVEASLVQLEHSILPAIVPPPPTDRLLKSIAGKQLMMIMNDLRKEADRINQHMQSGEAGAKDPKDPKDPKDLKTHTRKL